MPDGCAPCCPEEDTYVPCCLSLSCLWEPVDVCWLICLCLVGICMISSQISSSTWGSISAFWPMVAMWTHLQVWSLLCPIFLLLSSLRRVCSAGTYGASVCCGGAFPWSCSFEEVGWSIIFSCCESTTSFPFAIPTSDVVLSWEACGAAAIGVPSPTCCGSLNVTYPKESKSRFFSKKFIVCSIFSSLVNSSTSVPATQSSWLEICSICGIFQCS